VEVAPQLLPFGLMSREATPSCLTEAQIGVVLAAPPGQVPTELARHLAACERCQERVLFGTTRRTAGRTGRRAELPSVRKALLLGALALVAMAGFFYTLLKLAGRVQ
jgi:hypothetical protein